MGIIKFKHVSQEKIWGSEEWIISAHPNGMSEIVSEEYEGQDLKTFFELNKEKFGVDNDILEFPLLVKIIDAKDDLSVQVHPGDEYARKHEDSLGKSECWLILSDNPSDIVIGQKAKTREELSQAIEDNQMMEKLNIFDINKDDFFYIPPGCVHAIRSNTKILEVQQSSDITYRLYDYQRRDNEGNLRDLHVNKSLDVIDYDFENKNDIKVVEDNEQYKEEVLTDNEYFIVKRITIKDSYTLKANDKYILGVNLENELVCDENKLNPYESFMLLKGEEVKVVGNGQIIITTSK